LSYQLVLHGMAHVACIAKRFTVVRTDR
jgi:hypothetical protein